MSTRFFEGPFGGPVTNTPPRKPSYGPLFFLRTSMLLFALVCTSVSIALEFWAAHRSIQNQNALLNAFQSGAVVWVSVHDIYTPSTVTAVGLCFLWIILALGLVMSLVNARRPYESFGGVPYIISALSFWILISGGAETWFFARAGPRIYVAVNNVQVPQSEVDAVIIASGVPLRYRDTTTWRVAIAFVWVTWAVAVITAVLLFVSDNESARFTRPTNFSTEAGIALPPTRKADIEEKEEVVRIENANKPPLLRSTDGNGDDSVKSSVVNFGIQEVPIDGEKVKSDTRAAEKDIFAHLGKN